MNERRFLRKITAKREQIYSILSEALEEKENTALTIPRKKCKPRGLFKWFKNRSLEQIIEDNFETILNNTSDILVRNVILLLLNSKSTKSIVLNNFDKVLHRFAHIQNNIFYDEEDVNNAKRSLNFNMRMLLRELSELPEGCKAIEQNIDDILANTPGIYLFDTAQAIKGISEKCDAKINEYLRKSKEDVAKSLLMKNGIKNGERYKTTLAIMIDELLESEKVNFSDIANIDGGAYSEIYQIGNKILKVGIPRETYDIHNHRRILQPVIRTNFIDEHNNPIACIEIMEKVEKVKKEDCPKEVLYEIYKELRDVGIFWTDAKFANIGRLTKPNVPLLNGEEINVAPNSVGFDKNIEGEPLKAGDLVILDIDYIYSTESPQILWPDNSYSVEFERRWQRERTIGTKYQTNKLKSNEERKEDYEK